MANISSAVLSVTNRRSKMAMANRAMSLTVEMMPLAGVLNRVSTTLDERSPKRPQRNPGLNVGEAYPGSSKVVAVKPAGAKTRCFMKAE